MWKKLHLLLIASIFIITGCASKFFPDKKLYQYPEKTNDMAVVYPDGSIHHSDGSITRNGKKNPSNSTPGDISAITDSTGRHARHRGGE